MDRAVQGEVENLVYKLIYKYAAREYNNIKRDKDFQEYVPTEDINFYNFRDTADWEWIVHEYTVSRNFIVEFHDCLTAPQLYFLYKDGQLSWEWYAELVKGKTTDRLTFLDVE